MRYCRFLLILGVLATSGLIAVVVCRAPLLSGVVGVVILAATHRRTRSLHAMGTARWASNPDLARAGMLEDGAGLCVGWVSTERPRFWPSFSGLFDGRLPAAAACERFVFSMRKLQGWHKATQVRLNRAVHTAIFAPTGVGKGVSLIVPFLRECQDSCVVIDPKGENARLTMDVRRAMGHRIVLLDPFKVVTQTPDTFNPLDMIDEASPLAGDDCRALAKDLVVTTGMEPDPHWNLSSEHMIAALIAAVLFMSKEHRSLQTVRTLLTDDARRAVVLAKMRDCDDWGGMLRRMANQVLNWKDKELAGILSTANRHTAFLDTLPVASSTQASSFDPIQLRAGKMSAFLILPPAYLKSQSALLRTWIGATFKACVRGGLDDSRNVHFVLDEAASLGKLDVLEDAVDKYRGYGVKLQLYYQSIGQLKQCWRDGLDQSLLSNTTQVYFGVNDQQTAQAVSDRLGEETIVVDSGGTNTGGSDSANKTEAGGQLGRSWGGSKNWAQQARKLLKPEEVAGLSPRTAVTFAPGVPPIATTMVRYYEEQPGNGQSRWRRTRTTAEVWMAAVGLLVLSSLGVWAAANLVQHPKNPPPHRAAP